MKTMTNKLGVIIIAGALSAPALEQPRNPSRGEQDFRACAPCQSLEPDAI